MSAKGPAQMVNHRDVELLTPVGDLPVLGLCRVPDDAWGVPAVCRVRLQLHSLSVCLENGPTPQKCLVQMYPEEEVGSSHLLMETVACV